jgi:hypothetical protein
MVNTEHVRLQYKDVARSEYSNIEMLIINVQHVQHVQHVLVNVRIITVAQISVPMFACFPLNSILHNTS